MSQPCAGLDGTGVFENNQALSSLLGALSKDTVRGFTRTDETACRLTNSQSLAVT